MAERFANKVVVITGASAGIGAAAARRFAAEGARVVLAARGAEGLEALAREIGNERALAVPTDVADAVAARALLDRAVAAYGAVNVLVNNAGYNRRGPVEQSPAEELARIVDVNLRAPIVLTRLAIPYLRRAGGGAIVNVASIAGRIPLPEEATYSATKFGLRAFTFALADELEGSGITVSAVSPGPVETGFILREVEEVPAVVFSQPMSSADEIATLILDCAADGTLERAHPTSSAYLATLGYLVPQIPRLLRPLLERQGRAAKASYIAKLRGGSRDPNH
jgi:short-subunit dehydrogenase